MDKIVIGIISYIPDKEPDKAQRIERFERLLTQLNELWPSLPIMVISQNWQDYNPKYKLIRFDYGKLGILPARKTLREKFLESEYDYLIMFDDDAIIEYSDPSAPERYLKLINDNPNKFMFLQYFSSQLNGCAISKHIYTLEPMVDVSAEDNEGFEDAIFSCLLHNKYPDKEFTCDFIKCTHFRNPKETAPSTWANEGEKEWEKLRARTEEIKQYIIKHKEMPDLDSFLDRQKTTFTHNIFNRVDLVVPYVNAEDVKWQKLYNKYNPTKEKNEETNALSRFRGQGNFFKYFFRCLDKNLPWLGTVHLLVQSESQIPSWINRDKVNIVLHEEFIPKKYLPTFNSTCIEMFLHNIPGLSERFLYANDDILIIQPLNLEDFYKDNLIKTNTFNSGGLDTLYGHHKVNAYCLIYDKDKDEVMKQGKVMSLSHLVRPYLKSQIELCFKEHQETITNSISKFRQENNLNVYLFDHYIIKNGKQYPREGIKNKIIYSSAEDRTLASIFDVKGNYFSKNKINMLNIQDNIDTINIYENYYINYYFRYKYPRKSKYEK